MAICQTLSSCVRSRTKSGSRSWAGSEIRPGIFRLKPTGTWSQTESCGLYIAEKLGVSQPTASEHLRVLTQAGLLQSKRIKQWTFYKRDERRIREIKKVLASL